MVVLGVVGEFSGWGRNPDTPMTETFVGSKIYTAFMPTNFYGAFKFRQDNVWTTNYGGDWNTGNLFINGDNIIAPRFQNPTSYYTLTLNFNTLTFTYAITGDPTLYVEPNNWGIVGQFTGWGGNPDILMTETYKGSNRFTAVMPTNFNGEFKFRKNSSWTYNYGGNWDTGNLVKNSNYNIFAPPLESNSYYTITLDLNTLTFSIIINIRFGSFLVECARL
jgi:hypothetical protein